MRSSNAGLSLPVSPLAPRHSCAMAPFHRSIPLHHSQLKQKPDGSLLSALMNMQEALIPSPSTRWSEHRMGSTHRIEMLPLLGAQTGNTFAHLSMLSLLWESLLYFWQIKRDITCIHVCFFVWLLSFYWDLNYSVSFYSAFRIENKSFHYYCVCVIWQFFPPQLF